MKTWLRRLRAVSGVVLSWAAGWALFGLLIGVASNLLPFLPWHYFFAVFDGPLPALAIPGFVGGALFSTVLGVAGRRRRFDELSLPRFAADRRRLVRYPQAVTAGRCIARSSCRTATR